MTHHSVTQRSIPTLLPRSTSSFSFSKDLPRVQVDGWTYRQGYHGFNGHNLNNSHNHAHPPCPHCSVNSKIHDLHDNDNTPLTPPNRFINNINNNNNNNINNNDILIPNPWITWFKLFRDKWDLVHLFYALIWFTFCVFMVSMANAYADRINPNNKIPLESKYVAPDIVLEPAFKFFQSNTWIPRDIPDVLVQTCTLLCLLRCFMFGQWSVTVLRRCFWIIGFLYLLRAPFVSLTVLPTPWIECEAKFDPDFFTDTFQLFSQQRMPCGDVFFSGHTILFTISILVYWTYNTPSPAFHLTKTAVLIPPAPTARSLHRHHHGHASTTSIPQAPMIITTRYLLLCYITNIIVTLLAIIGSFSLILASYHYTIDVIMAIVVTVTAWTGYHWCVRIPGLKYGTWVGRLINWCDYSPNFSITSPLSYSCCYCYDQNTSCCAKNMDELAMVDEYKSLDCELSYVIESSDILYETWYPSSWVSPYAWNGVWNGGKRRKSLEMVQTEVMDVEDGEFGERGEFVNVVGGVEMVGVEVEGLGNGLGNGMR